MEASRIGLLLGIIAWCSPLMAYLLPPEFILQKTIQQWKDAPGIVLQREVQGGGSTGRVREQVYIRGGQVRVESGGQVWVYPAPARQASEADAPFVRPGWIDAVFVQSSMQLTRSLDALGVSQGSVSLVRIATPTQALPFRVAYRIGTGGDSAAPHLDIEKETWVIRGIQARDPAEGSVWRAEYSGFGSLPDVPAWMPVRTDLFRDGERAGTLTVLRRISLTIQNSHFTPVSSEQVP